jgi:hypothetical protein
VKNLDKIKHVEIHGNNNLVIQDIEGGKITINLSDKAGLQSFMDKYQARLEGIEALFKEQMNASISFDKLLQEAKNIGNQYGNNNLQTFK